MGWPYCKGTGDFDPPDYDERTPEERAEDLANYRSAMEDLAQERAEMEYIP